MTVKSFKILKNKIIKNKKGSVIKFLTKKIFILNLLEKFISQRLMQIKQKVGITIKNIPVLLQFQLEKWNFRL